LHVNTNFVNKFWKKGCTKHVTTMVVRVFWVVSMVLLKAVTLAFKVVARVMFTSQNQWLYVF